MIVTPTNEYYLKDSGLLHLTLSSSVEPQFVQDDDFRTIIYRFVPEENTQHDTPHDTPHDTMQVIQESNGEDSDEMRNKFGIIADEIRMKFGVNVLKTIELIAKNPEITAEAIASELNLNPRTIENYLAKLKENNYLKREGSKKVGRYVIIRKE